MGAIMYVDALRSWQREHRRLHPSAGEARPPPLCRLRKLNFHDAQVCAGARAGRAKLEFTWLQLRRGNKLANSGDASRLACDEYVGLVW